MDWFRRRLACVTCGWLCCQLSLLTAAPLSLVSTAPHAADSMTCSCVHGGSAQCPMHHPARPKPDCQCRSTTDHDAAAIVSLLGPIAVLAPATQGAPLAPAVQVPVHPLARFDSVVTPPDGPPPRA